VDYLNWIHGDRRIELNKVLGKLPGGNRTRTQRNPWSTLPSADFEADGDLARWAATKGKLAATSEWSSCGERGMVVELEPGGAVTYTPPDDAPIEVRREHLGFGCELYCGDPAFNGTGVTVVLVGDNGKRYRLAATLGAPRVEWVRRYLREGPPPFQRLVKLIITTDSTRPIRFYVDDVAVARHSRRPRLTRRTERSRRNGGFGRWRGSSPPE
jgi:hypothetical protein